QWRGDETQFKDARTAALEELNRSLGRNHLLDGNFGNRVDYIPEVKSFRLRFYDGESWTDRWDAKQRRRLPMTVELSFEIDLDLPQQIDDTFSRFTEEFTFEDLQAEEEAAALVPTDDEGAMPVDDQIRSSQTMAYVPPNQFLIHLAKSSALVGNESDLEAMAGNQSDEDPSGDSETTDDSADTAEDDS
ncbi:MAG: hypothetical protein KDB27_15015, partial [Planctomycetales bacterium]|nr:hypothetical protein [Planctomycetales bacterium]